MTRETRDTLRKQLGEPDDSARLKAIRELDEHCERILAMSPFAVVATAGADGSCDASPHRGPPGFIRMLSPTRLAMVAPGPLGTTAEAPSAYAIQAGLDDAYRQRLW